MKTQIQRDYNARGLILREYQSNDYEIFYEYDTLSRRLKLILPNQSSIAYQYNANHLMSIERLSAKNRKLYTHHYQEFSLTGQILKTKLLNGLTCQYSYDPMGRPQLITSSKWSQSVPNDGYDKIGNLLKTEISDPA